MGLSLPGVPASRGHLRDLPSVLGVCVRYDYMFLDWVCLCLGFQLPGGTQGSFTDEL